MRRPTSYNDVCIGGQPYPRGRHDAARPASVACDDALRRSAGNHPRASRPCTPTGLAEPTAVAGLMRPSGTRTVRVKEIRGPTAPGYCHAALRAVQHDHVDVSPCGQRHGGRGTWQGRVFRRARPSTCTNLTRPIQRVAHTIMRNPAGQGVVATCGNPLRRCPQGRMRRTTSSNDARVGDGPHRLAMCHATRLEITHAVDKLAHQLS